MAIAKDFQALLEIVGTCDKRIFGLDPAERLKRQIHAVNRLRDKHGKPRMGVAASASAVIDEAALQWLLDNPGQLLTSAKGTPLAVAAPVERISEARAVVERGGPGTIAGGRHFVRKLRRRVELLGVSLDEGARGSVERRLYGNAYKGVTDLITKYVWPEPAFHVTRLCARLRMTPNMVTSVGVLLMFIATYLFHEGHLGWGLLAAWTMTFLDTVDGKLARVTVTSSWFGNLLDHGTDILHPPLWWWAVTVGLAGIEPARTDTLWLSFTVVLITYVVSRILEEGFKRKFGFNAFIWQPFDSRFRMVISRRNILLLVLTIGLVAGLLSESWVVAAAWSFVSVLVQGWRFVTAWRAARSGPLTCWLA
ncbi:MAG: CDP-alcohol phosphatidyltransferase [uncultured Sphingomonas sp.]|uniref:CDP-alcohol phosphatidyltransferase n=1 Tax=uncultured Sphingomonas sp. TaxID=158754 RepID=A0A6J4T9G4_9SPHN|nr:MAG: CDP-alcohol phosphatidyltransferase [uncultured Sphingomonas sp.]